MKNLLIVLAVIFSACSSQKMNKKEAIIFKNAFSQKWYGGVQGSGYGTNYRFFFQKLTDDAITFDTVWIEDRPHIPQVANISYPMQEVQEGHEFSLNMQYKRNENPYTGETQDIPQKQEEQSPEFAGEALIVYHVNGERRTMIVSTLEFKEPDFYP